MADDDYRVIHADIRKFAAQFGGFLRAAEKLAEIASIEQAIVEADGRLHAARQRETEAEAARAEAQQAADQEADETKKRGIAVYAEHVAKAHKIVSDARDQANTIVGEARISAAKIGRSVEEANAQRNAELVTLTQQIDAARQQAAQTQQKLDAVNDAKEDASKEHARIMSMIAELKAKL